MQHKFKFIFEHRFVFQIAKMCKVLEVSRSGYYAYASRGERKRATENRKLLKTINEIHEKSRKIYGAPQITNNLPDDSKGKQRTCCPAYENKRHQVKSNKEIQGDDQL